MQAASIDRDVPLLKTAVANGEVKGYIFSHDFAGCGGSVGVMEQAAEGFEKIMLVQPKTMKG